MESDSALKTEVDFLSEENTVSLEDITLNKIDLPQKDKNAV